MLPADIVRCSCCTSRLSWPSQRSGPRQQMRTVTTVVATGSITTSWMSVSTPAQSTSDVSQTSARLEVIPPPARIRPRPTECRCRPAARVGQPRAILSTFSAAIRSRRSTTRSSGLQWGPSSSSGSIPRATMPGMMARSSEFRRLMGRPERLANRHAGTMASSASLRRPMMGSGTPAPIGW